MEIYKESIAEFSKLIKNKDKNSYNGQLRVGIDLGTANIVLSVIDEEDTPIAGATYPSTVVKDGIVVDFVGGIKIVEKLKKQIEELLGVELKTAATAIPPGITKGNIKAITNVVEGAGFEVVNVVDEPTAASKVLKIENGVIVDVGGGTTGISIIKDNKVVFSADEATGGSHMTLVLAGYHKISIEEAEILKKDPTREEENFTLVTPVIEKMATIVKKFLKGYDVPAIYVVGGACTFKEFSSIFEKIIGIQTIKTNDPLLVTPLGIAMSVIS